MLILSSCCASLRISNLFICTPIILALEKCRWHWALLLQLDGGNMERERKSECDGCGASVNLELKIQNWNPPVWCIGNRFHWLPSCQFPLALYGDAALTRKCVYRRGSARDKMPAWPWIGVTILSISQVFLLYLQYVAYTGSLSVSVACVCSCTNVYSRLYSAAVNRHTLVYTYLHIHTWMVLFVCDCICRYAVCLCTYIKWY